MNSDIQTVIKNRRSIRQYKQAAVPASVLLELVENGRLYASAGNKQPIAFAVVTQSENVSAVFDSLNWAMYLDDFSVTPEYRPTAYILLLSAKEEATACRFDAGAAATTIMLDATARGLATCCLMAARPDSMAQKLALPDGLTPLYAIAIGEGAHSSCITPYVDTPKYSRDGEGTFFVPKKALQEVIAFCDADV